MRVHSKLSSDSYLPEMKAHMGSFWDFGADRFTGFFLGSFFSVTYHSGYEWNRRITNEKHRAIGFVRPAADGTEVRCIRLAGMTNPLSLIINYLLYLFIAWVTAGYFAAELYFVSLGLTLLTAGFSAFMDSVTERGEEGSRILTAFLMDPSDCFALL